MTLRQMLAMHPKGATNDQIIWRLKSVGVRFDASELLSGLTSLSRSGEIVRDRLGRWRIASYSVPPVSGEARPVTPAGSSITSDHAEMLYAVSAQTKARPPLEEAIPESGETRGLPEWSSLLGYFAATQRLDPRGRIEEFEDRHGVAWQLFQTVGRWWADADLSIPVTALPETFREALVRRKIETAALGWPISIVKTPSGTQFLPALIVPARWRIDDDSLILTTENNAPAINPAWLREIRRNAAWGEEALITALLPEGEEGDLASISDRMKHALATLGGATLRPGELSPAVSLNGPVLRNSAAIFLPEDKTFTKGAAEDIETLRNWSPEQRSMTALDALFDNNINRAATCDFRTPLLTTRDLTDSQTDAAEASLRGPLTVIQGPPGTGKSEVILSLIVSALMSGRTVLFAAKNHQAIDEVEGRLRALVPSAPILVRARDAEGEQDVSFLDALAELAASSHGVSGEPDEVEKLLEIGRSLEDARAADRELLRVQLELSEMTERAEAMRRGATQSQKRLMPKSMLRAIMAFIKRLFGRKPSGDLPKTASLVEIEGRIASLRSSFRLLKEARSQLESVRHNQVRDDLKAALPKLAEHRLKPDSAEWALLAERVKELEFQKVKSARKMPPEDAMAVVRKRPVWGISTLSAPARIPLVPGLFDYVIFDEASQCDIASALPLFARAKAAVVVGDPMQLRFVPSLGALTEHALMDAAGLPAQGRSRFAQSINSLFDFAERRPSASRMFLADQFRSAAPIVDYLNQDFYNGRLMGRREDDSFKVPRDYKPGLMWEDVTGQVIRRDGGNVNAQEAEKVASLVQRILNGGYEGSIGVISPFNTQVGAIQAAVQRLGVSLDSAKLRIATVDKFQGAEADIVLFSLVLAPGAPASATTFMQKERRRLNVAVSRARALCIVVGDLSHAKTCRIPHIEFLAQRASMPWSPPRPQQYESDWERRLATAMRERGLTPFPQYPVGTRYLDFAIDPEGKKIDIEVDGRRWHTDASGNRKVADRLRDIELQGRGWTVLRFWVHELANDMGACLDTIEQTIAR